MSLIAGRVESRIHTVLAGQRAGWAAEQPALAELFDGLDAFVAAGGKRLRPAFCYWGAVAGRSNRRRAGAARHLRGTRAPPRLRADPRRRHGRQRHPAGSARRPHALRGAHAAAGWAGESRRHGEGLAILTGDLAFVLADGLLDAAPASARRLWHELRVELVAGQWVDVVASAGTDRSPALARWVARYKSGRYTVERPLQLGAALAGDDILLAGYSAFGAPLGQAFQLRDDILGVFGDPSETGKPSGDDLREGKPTLLLALGSEYASGTDRRLIDRVGSPDLDHDEVAELRSLFERCGARAMVEAEIERLVMQSERALALWAIDPDVRDQLHALAACVTARAR